MPQIDVSPEVLDLIRSLKGPGESTENDTLARILGDTASARDRLLAEYERAEQDVQSTN